MDQEQFQGQQIFALHLKKLLIFQITTAARIFEFVDRQAEWMASLHLDALSAAADSAVSTIREPIVGRPQARPSTPPQ